MLQKLSHQAQHDVAHAGYKTEVLAAPLLDASSPTPYARLRLLDDDNILYTSALYQNAQPAYLNYHRNKIFHLDSPFEPALLPWVFDGVVYIYTDHLAWLRAMDYGRRQTNLGLYCTLAEFMNCLADWRAHSSVEEWNLFIDDDIVSAQTTHASWTLYSFGMREQAMALAAGALDGFRVGEWSSVKAWLHTQ